MFNYKLALSRFNFHHRERRKPPADFGSMYFVYPSEAVDYFDIHSNGLIDKIRNVIHHILHKPDEDADYYKNTEF
jgi:hypothetical protein